MIYPGNPVELPPQYTGIISGVVDKFVAGEPLLQAIHWYHDQPIWFIRTQDGNIVRRVQIAAFLAKQNERRVPVIRVIPDAYKLKDNKIEEYIRKDDIEANIKTVCICDSKPPYQVLSPQKVENDLALALSEAWNSAQRLTL